MVISRRSLVSLFPLVAGRPFYVRAAQTTVTRPEIDRLLDTKNPTAHCTLNHNHADDSFDDWRGSLVWSASDCGHNEGAGAVLKLAARYGLAYPELMRGCPETEGQIPTVDLAMNDPGKLDYALGVLPDDKVKELKEAVRQGKSFVEILVKAVDVPGGDRAVGEVWRRVAMMRFASKLAANHNPAPATAIAVASQWHNCQAFRCLLRHPSEVAAWLLTAAK